ncbi:MAG: methyltransferase [Pseudorhodoplanes sp.]|nr:methyltransferase [Pseudorhodoplanes sp.]
MPDPAITDDSALGGRLRLLQPARGHRFGHDAILLAACIPAAAGEHAVELGAGVGAAGLALLARVPNAKVTLVEIDPALTALATENIVRNGMERGARAVTLDVGAPARAFLGAGLPPACADHVLMNPPFNDATHQASPDAARRRAHRAHKGLLAAWLGTAARLVKPGGTVTLIGRAAQLGEALADIPRSFGGVRILPVFGKPEQPAIRILVQGIAGSREALSLLPGLTLNDSAGRPTAEAEAAMRNAESLPLAAIAASRSRPASPPAGERRPRSSRA